MTDSQSEQLPLSPEMVLTAAREVVTHLRSLNKPYSADVMADCILTIENLLTRPAAQAPLGPCTQAELDAWEKHLDKKDAQLLLMWVDRALKAEAALVMSATTRETPEPLTACAKCQNTGWCHGQGWCQNSGVALPSTDREAGK